MAIVTRSSKGSTLTWAEQDNNFTELSEGRVVATTEGDKAILSTDPSLMREGTWFHTYGAIYTLFSDAVMWYQSHNVALDPATGDFLGADDSDPCTIWGFTETGQLFNRYDAATNGAGQIPGVDASWVLSFSINASGFNGVIGASTRNSIAATSGNFNLGVTVTGRPLDLPVFTTAQKNALLSVAEGAMVYDSDLARPCFRNASTWVTL